MSTPIASPCDKAAMAAVGADGVALCSERARPWILAATILASGMVFIDGTVVNVALPALQNEFGTNAADAQWVVESYALLLAALLLVGGSAGDRFGRRLVFVIGIILFAVASAWCGLAHSMQELWIARALQGIGGALLVPGSLAIISASFPEEARGKAIGTWSGFTAITAALGPVIGGFLIEHFSWRYAFLINIPFALAVLLLTFATVPESRNTKVAGPLDWPGAVLISIGLGALVFGLIDYSTHGWSRGVQIAVPVAALAIAGFVAVELRHSSPMLPMTLFRSRDFSGANLLTLLLYAGLGGGLFFFPLNLIQVQGYSAMAAGAALLPFILTMFVLSRWAGGLVDRHGAKLPLIAGPSIAAAGFALFALPGIGGSYWITFFPAVMVLGLGMAISVAPLTTTVMNAVETELAGAASGVNNAVSRVAALLAIAVFGIVMSAAFRQEFAARAASLPVSPSVLQQVMSQQDRLAAIDVPAEAAASEKAALTAAVGESFVHGFRWVMLLSALLAAAGAVSAWRLIGVKS